MQPTLLLFFSFSLIVGQWIDPHSMDSRHKTKLSPGSSPDAPGCVGVPKKECVSDVHLRRIVRIILNNAYLDKDVGEGYINIKLSPVEHQLLINFSQSTEEPDIVINEVSSIFEKAFQKPAAERYQELILSLQEKLYNALFNQTSGALVGACLALSITYRLLKAQFNWKSIVKYFLFLAYIIDFLVTYLNIVREEEVESMVNIKKLGTAPPECDPGKMSWWGFIKTQFDSNPCKTYYLAMYPNSVFMIAPSKVFTRQFRSLIVEPCGDVGEAFGKFGRGMFTTLPWGLNVVIFPLMLVAACALVFIVFLFVTNPHFKISLFHLFTIELGKPMVTALPNNNATRGQIEWTPQKKRRRINNNSGREVGIVENQRIFVEEVSSSSGNHGQKQTEKNKVKQEKNKTKVVDETVENVDETSGSDFESSEDI